MLFQIKVGKIVKEETNTFFKNKYASLSNILDAIQIPLAEAGLTFSQMPDGDETLTTILIHAESGEYMLSSYSMHAAKKDPQGIGSAITYARRYALGAVLGLNIDVDDDGNAASGNDGKKEAAAPACGMKEKPFITNSQMTTLLSKIEKGDLGSIEKDKGLFRFTDDQKGAINGAVKMWKDKNTVAV